MVGFDDSKPVCGPRHACFQVGNYGKVGEHNATAAVVLENLPRIVLWKPVKDWPS